MEQTVTHAVAITVSRRTEKGIIPDSAKNIGWQTYEVLGQRTAMTAARFLSMPVSSD
jgi:hypothetical protein